MKLAVWLQSLSPNLYAVPIFICSLFTFLSEFGIIVKENFEIYFIQWNFANSVFVMFSHNLQVNGYKVRCGFWLFSLVPLESSKTLLPEKGFKSSNLRCLLGKSKWGKKERWGKEESKQKCEFILIFSIYSFLFNIC